MSLLRRIRGELAGAWRSVGYDLGRRPAGPVAGGPDVTSTGMNTFGASLVDLPVSGAQTDARPPRRFVAVTAFCALAALGAGGSYAVATRVFTEQRDPVAQVAAPAPGSAGEKPERPGAKPEPDGEAMGSVPVTGTSGRPRTAPQAALPAASQAAPAPGRVRAVGAGAVAVTGAATPVAPATEAGRRTTVAPRGSVRSASPECACLTPPVPTPTAAPHSPSVAPSPSPAAPSGTPASGGPRPPETPGGSPSAHPDGSPGTRDSDRRHRRHHRRSVG